MSGRKKNSLSPKVWEKIITIIFIIRRSDGKKKRLNFRFPHHHLHSIIIFLGKTEGRIYIKALPANSVKYCQDA